MEEIWKDIKGFEGLYQVSNLGRIKHLIGYNHKKEFILSPTINRKGYFYVTLSKKNIIKKFFVHRLVAMNFIENPKECKEVDHINAVRTDNRVENLRWCTRKENCNTEIYKKNSSKNGCWMYKRYLELSPRARKICQYDTNGKLIAVWKTAKEAEIKTNIKRSGICQCCKGKRNIAGGYIWKYYNNTNHEE
jgi:hypothetical protein